MSNILIKGTKATDCGTVYDIPIDTKIQIEDTEALRVQTVLKVRDNVQKFKEELYEHLVENTPNNVIEDFINSLQSLKSTDQNSVELATYRSGIDKFLKGTTANVINFSSAVIGIISQLPF